MTADSFRLLYSALDGNGTVQLWATDGTLAGTAELTAVANDWGGVFPGDITVFGGQAGFVGLDAAGRMSLWVTDGTAGGTAELAPAKAFAEGLDPKGLTALGSKLLFTGTDAGGHTGIWATEGTSAGTRELLSVAELGAGIGTPQTVVAGGRAYFAVNGRLVVSDGSRAGTAVIAAGLAGGDQPVLAAVGDGVVFAAAGGLWRSDGTVGGTVRIASVEARDLTAVGSGALFSGTDGHGVAQLWFTDGVSAHAVTGFAGATAPFAITALGTGAIFFTSGGLGDGPQLWVTDGVGATRLTALGAPGLTPTFVTVFGGHAVFTTDVGGVWLTDGTAAGTVSIAAPGFAGPGVSVGGSAYLATSGAEAGIYVTDGSLAGTTRLVEAPYAGGLTVLPGSVAPVSAAVTPACFLPGTRILTEHGQVAIEHLRAGDRVRTVFGGVRPLLWVGAGRARIGARDDHPARPVLIRAGALGPGVPSRDLALTQGHCLHFPDGDGPGALVPAALLVNGRSILLDRGVGEIAYFHLAVDGHDLVLAEGAACETWHNDGTAWQFDIMPPEQAGLIPCAPKLRYGPAATALWLTLRTRAGCPPARGTPDPRLHLLADGVRVEPDLARDGRYRFTLGGRPRELRIGSRTAIPAVAGLSPDVRRLGVGIRAVAVAQGGRLARFGPEDPVLGDGFHVADAAERLRWTGGPAALEAARLRLGRGAFRVELIAETLAAYPV